MGPKPFSSNSVDVSFDKVFAVPVAPGSQENLCQTPNAVAETETESNSMKPDLIVEIEIKSKTTFQYFLCCCLF